MDDGDDFDQDDYELQASELRPLGRVEAKDLLRGCLSALMLRSMLLISPAEIAREFGGMNEDEARISLACSELAELPSWDAQALLDAATIAADEEQRLMWGQLSREHLARRIGLALKCEGAGEFLTPAEGVFLLRKLNIHVFHELVDAVALMALDGPEPERTYRRLMGRPDSSGADTPPAPAPANQSSASESLASRKQGESWSPVHRAELLAAFRKLEGKRPKEAGKRGKHGALASLERQTGIDKDTLSTQLDKAIEEKRGNDALAQLHAAKG